jgi:type II secretory pathway component PulM
MKVNGRQNTGDMESGISPMLSSVLGRYASLLRHPSSALLLITLGFFVLAIPLFILQKSAAKDVGATRTKLKELSTLSAEYRDRKEKITAIEQKKSQRKVSGIPQAIDEISSSVGLRGKVKGEKAIGTKELAVGTEESAEVQIEKVTMNELVNFLYALDEAPVMITVRRTSVKRTFEDPGLFNLTLTLSLLQKK